MPVIFFGRQDIIDSEAVKERSPSPTVSTSSAGLKISRGLDREQDRGHCSGRTFFTLLVSVESSVTSGVIVLYRQATQPDCAQRSVAKCTQRQLEFEAEKLEKRSRTNEEVVTRDEVGEENIKCSTTVSIVASGDSNQGP